MSTLAVLIVLLIGQVASLENPPIEDEFEIRKPGVNGRIEYKENQRILNLWGTHYEMGYAHGWLLGEDIVTLCEEYGLGVMADPITYETQLLPLARYAFVTPARYQEEMNGIYDGMVASGTDLHLDALGRDFAVDDLLVINLIADLGQFACSVTFGWGAATAADPELGGGSAYVRDLDWGLDPSGCLNTMSVLITFDSSLPDEKPLVLTTWPGLISVLTAMSSDGVCASVDYGDHRDMGFIYPSTYTGIGFSLREGLERCDFDGNGHANHFDVYQAVLSHTTVASFELSLLSPYPVPGDVSAGAGAVIEINYYGEALRDSSNNMDYTPFLSATDLLAVTNHHRLLYTPAPCWRYNRQVSRLSEDFAVNTAELWDIESEISNIGTHQMVCFRPNLMDMYVAFNETFNGAANSNRVYYQWSELYPNH